MADGQLRLCEGHSLLWEALVDDLKIVIKPGKLSRKQFADQANSASLFGREQLYDHYAFQLFVPGPIVAIGVGMRDRTIAAPYLVLLFLHKVAVRLEGGPTLCGTSAYGPKLTSAQSATMSASDPKRT